MYVTPRALHAPARLAGTPLLRTQSDQRLVDLVRVGNDGAFEAIVARYRRALLRYCSRILPEGRAEDVVQQSFLRAYDALRASEGEMALRPWLYRIAHNQSLNALRDRSLGHEELSDAIDGVERPDQALERRERLRDTLDAVEALPERQRNAIVLRELEGRSYDEIAAELGVTGGAVRALLNRARGTLRAGMTAVTPWALMARMPWATEGGEGMALRVAELCGAGAGGAVIAKTCATVLVTGAVVGGVATAPDGGPSDGRAGSRPAETGMQGGSAREPATELGPGDDRDGGGRAGERGRDNGEDDDRSGRRDGDDDEDDDRSGPGGGDGDDDNSGPGGGGDDPQPDNSGPGSSSSGPGSGGSGSSGSDSSGPGSGGSGSSGSGSSGSGSSGSGSSGSGSSGSGSSGSASDSSGSGSGDEPDPDDDA